MGTASPFVNRSLSFFFHLSPESLSARIGWAAFASRPRAVLLVCALLCFRGLVQAAPVEGVGKIAALGWDENKQGLFTTCLLRDREGDIWVGTEDKGVWRYTADPAHPGQKKWIDYSVAQGVGDDCVYALAQDPLGRIWAGTMNHGVSVWNGQGWHVYNVLDGPLGEHVFSMATSPLDGDVWIATNAGLTRYSTRHDSWRYYTRAGMPYEQAPLAAPRHPRENAPTTSPPATAPPSSLPSDQVRKLAFDAQGTLFAGTLCDGLAIAHPGDDYRSWRVESGPPTMPSSATGSGLPSSEINDILVTPDTVYIATPCGLAHSSDGGTSWNYIRGEDWKAKVEGQRTHPVAVPLPAGFSTDLLREDYVASIGQDSHGVLTVGFWRLGYEERRPSGEKVLLVSGPKPNKDSFFIRVALGLPDGTTLLASYGDGLTQTAPAPAFTPDAADGRVQTGAQDAARAVLVQEKNRLVPTVPGANPSRTVGAPLGVVPVALAFPAPAKAPTRQQLSMFASNLLVAPSQPMAPGDAYYEGEDWRTMGDWVGRYGTRTAQLCAVGAPFDHNFVNDPSYGVTGMMGPNFPDNSLRHWVHELRIEEPRVLYNPKLGYRRQADWDDNAETMPMTVEGPDVWAKVTVPAGTHRISFYVYNEDRDYHLVWLRDYTLEVRKGEATTVEQAERLPTQAKARLYEFWGGVYKRFVVQGPGTFWVKVAKNNSWNTIMCGIFLDKLAGPDTGHESSRSPWLGKVRYEVDTQAALKKYTRTGVEIKDPVTPTTVTTVHPLLAASQSLWGVLDDSWSDPQFASLQWSQRIAAMRAVGALGYEPYTPTYQQRLKGGYPVWPLMKRWRWQLALWNADDRAEFQTTMKQGYESLLSSNPRLRNVKF